MEGERKKRGLARGQSTSMHVCMQVYLSAICRPLHAGGRPPLRRSYKKVLQARSQCKRPKSNRSSRPIPVRCWAFASGLPNSHCAMGTRAVDWFDEFRRQRVDRTRHSGGCRERDSAAQYPSLANTLSRAGLAA